MDKIEYLYLQGWRFLCSGEPLASGVFQAAVRYRSLIGDEVGTLVLDLQSHPTASQAIEQAREVAAAWAYQRGKDDHGCD